MSCENCEKIARETRVWNNISWRAEKYYEQRIKDLYIEIDEQKETIKRMTEELQHLHSRVALWQKNCLNKHDLGSQ